MTALLYTPDRRCDVCHGTLFTGVDAWYRAYARNLCRSIARKCAGAPIDADDIVQEAYAELIRRMPTVEHPGRWLNTVARSALGRAFAEFTRSANGALRSLEHDEREVMRSPTRITWTSLPVVADEHTREDARRAIDAIQQLPDRQRVVAHLYLVEDWPQVEIAAFLNITPGAVAKHVHDARRTLNRPGPSRSFSKRRRVTYEELDEERSRSSDKPAYDEAAMAVWVWCSCWAGEPRQWQIMLADISDWAVLHAMRDHTMHEFALAERHSPRWRWLARHREALISRICELKRDPARQAKSDYWDHRLSLTPRGASADTT